MYYDMQSDRLYNNEYAMEGIFGKLKDKFQNRKEKQNTTASLTHNFTMLTEDSLENCKNGGEFKSKIIKVANENKIVADRIAIIEAYYKDEWDEEIPNDVKAIIANIVPVGSFLGTGEYTFFNFKNNKLYTEIHGNGDNGPVYNKPQSIEEFYKSLTE